MKHLLMLILFLIFNFQFVIAQEPDTVIINCPDAWEKFDYDYADYTIYPGDESSIQIISQPNWLTVGLEETTNWGIQPHIHGDPLWVDNYEVTLGWFEINLETLEEDLWTVYIFQIDVLPSVCMDPNACNFVPYWVEDEHCLYEVSCWQDPCNYETCEAYPNAECMADYCGDCYADFYVNDILVNCIDPPEDCTILGDTNNDGEVNVIDIIIMVCIWPPCGTECSGDVNGDGTVNVLDIVMIVNIILEN
ncbi:MAG: hypothetical protein H8E85_04695 [Candidatus Marinimicrobia bacterium]|nr:hypothetical protein [Candidatus Neomarinimicrobiota bacterium]